MFCIFCIFCTFCIFCIFCIFVYFCIGSVIFFARQSGSLSLTELAQHHVALSFTSVPNVVEVELVDRLTATLARVVPFVGISTGWRCRRHTPLVFAMRGVWWSQLPGG